MPKVSFRPLQAGDVAYIAEHLREADRREVEAVRGPRFADAIARAVLRSSHYWTAVSEEGEPLAVFGVVPVSIISGIGSPWFLATERANEHPRNLVVEGRRYLSAMRAIYPRLYNYVDARNDKSIRWLRRLGFTLHPPQPYGVAGLPFHKFEIGGTE